MMLGRPLAALLCSALAAASALKHFANDEADSKVEFSYGSPTGQVPFGDMRQDDAHAWPHPHRPNKDTGDKTIYQVLNDDDNFSRFVKVINISDEVVSLLNSSSSSVTLFALPNSALNHPKHKEGGHKQLFLSALSTEDPVAMLDASRFPDLANIAAEFEVIESSLDDDDEEKEKRKKWIKIIVRALLEYHILPKTTDLSALIKNNTHATNLSIPDAALDNESLRIRVGTKVIPPSVNINFFSTIVTPDIPTKNGVIHVLNHPILPPASIFQTLFLAPKGFGTLTSAIQRVKLTNAVEWRYVPGEDKWELEGSASSTFFAPLNVAFQKLPWKLRLFLFSPFGERILDKLLQFHVVPGFVVHSDYLHNATVGEPIAASAPTSAWVTDNNVQGLVDDEEPFDTERFFLSEDHGHHGKGHKYERGHKHERDHEDKKGDKGRKGRKGRKGPRKQPQHTPPHHPQPEYAANITLPTLLFNHTVDVHVLKYKNAIVLPGHKFDFYTTKVFVNHQSVWVVDVPSRNGAFHGLGSVLSPHPHHGKHVKGLDGDEVYDSWVDWEEWLIDWADAN